MKSNNYGSKLLVQVSRRLAGLACIVCLLSVHVFAQTGGPEPQPAPQTEVLLPNNSFHGTYSADGTYVLTTPDGKTYRANLGRGGRVEVRLTADGKPEFYSIGTNPDSTVSSNARPQTTAPPVEKPAGANPAPPERPAQPRRTAATVPVRRVIRKGQSKRF